jgi:hypothetical protein
MLVDCTDWNFNGESRGYIVKGFAEDGRTYVRQVGEPGSNNYPFMSNPLVKILAEGMAYDQT